MVYKCSLSGVKIDLACLMFKLCKFLAQPNLPRGTIDVFVTQLTPSSSSCKKRDVEVLRRWETTMILPCYCTVPQTTAKVHIPGRG